MLFPALPAAQLIHHPVSILSAPSVTSLSRNQANSAPFQDPYKSAAPSSYVSQPRPQQQAPPPRSAVPVVALPGHLPSHASTSSYPSEQQRDMRLQSAKPDARTNPSGFSSDASTATNVLYNGNVAGSSIGTSAGTAVSEREVEGKMEKMGLDGVTASRRRASCMSVEMADGTPGTSLVGRTTESGRGATTGAAALSYPQQVDSPQRPILHTASDSTTSSVSRTSSVARKTASRYSLTDFTFLRTLGTGSFGRVHLVRSQHNSRSYAVKVLSKDRVVKMKQIEHTNSEREMLERVRHPFLVNLWGTFKDSKNLYMVMDFVAGGELFSLLRKSQVRSFLPCGRGKLLLTPSLSRPAVPRPGRQVLRRRSRSRPRLPTLSRHHLPRS